MRRSALRGFAIAVLLLAIGSLSGVNVAHSKKVQDFEIEGIALWECQCPALGCPCQRNGRPTHGTCHASDFAHITKGHFGDIRLDGLNVAMVGNLVDANSDRLFATLYLDDKATPEQSEALTRIVDVFLRVQIERRLNLAVTQNTVLGSSCGRLVEVGTNQADD